MAFGNLGTIWAEIGLDTKKLNKGVASASTTMQKFSTKMLIGGAVITAAVAGIGIASIKTAAEFEKNMRNVNSITGLSEKQFAEMSKEVIDLSKELPQSASILASGLYDIASSGFAGAEGLEVLDAAARAASAGLTTTEVSAKGITAVLNAYNFSAEEATRVSDTMFKTVDKGVITFEELSQNIGEVLSTGNLASIQFEELSGALGYMTIKGINAAEATTSLNRLILEFIDPSAELAEVLRNAGYETGEMALKQLGLIGSMELVQNATGGNVTELNAMFKEIRALRGASALLGSGMDSLTDYMVDFNDTAGATNTVLAEQEKGLNYQLDILKNNVSAIAIELGSKLIPKITDTVKGFNELDAETKDNIYDMFELSLKVGGASGAILLLGGAIGKLIGFFGTLAGAISLAVAAPVAFTIAMDKLSDTVENKWASAVLDGLSPVHAMVEQFSLLKGAANLVERGMVDWFEVLTMGKRELEDFIKANKDAVEGTAIFTEELHVEKLAMIRSAEGLKIRTEKMNDATEAIENQTKSIDDLLSSLFELYNLNQSVTEATWDYDDAQKELIKVLADSESSERDIQEAMFAVQDAREDLINSIYEEITAEDISIKRQGELRAEFIKVGQEAVASGEITEQAFRDMLTEFNNTVSGVIRATDNMVVGVNRSTDRIRTDIPINVYYKVGKPPKPDSSDDYDTGGVVPKAQSGMVVPSIGGGIPIIAHRDEVILNSQQQAKLLFDIARGNKSVGNDKPIEIRNVVELDGEIIYENQKQYEFFDRDRKVE